MSDLARDNVIYELANSAPVPHPRSENRSSHPLKPKQQAAAAKPAGAAVAVPSVSAAAGTPTSLTQKHLARRWHMSHRTLERWRCADRGPPYIKLFGRILYRLDDIERFEKEHLHTPQAAV